jgi:hypothetical protein
VSLGEPSRRRFAGQTVGLIHEVPPVAEIISRTVGGFHEIRRAQGERSLAGAF